MADRFFIQDLLSGRRQLLALDALRPAGKVEKFHAFTIGALLDYCNEHLQEALEYIPNNPTANNVCRQYLLNVSIHDPDH